MGLWRAVWVPSLGVWLHVLFLYPHGPLVWVHLLGNADLGPAKPGLRMACQACWGLRHLCVVRFSSLVHVHFAPRIWCAVGVVGWTGVPAFELGEPLGDFSILVC